MLRATLDSVLVQGDTVDYQVVVLDNASTDDTAVVVSAFDDSRAVHVRNTETISQYRNWVRGLELNRSEYVTILPDDDLYLPGFIERSVEALDANPSAGFSVTRARYIGEDGAPLPEDHAPGELPDTVPSEVSGRCMNGREFLRHVVEGQGWIYLQPVMVMTRSSVMAAVGSFDPRHSKTVFDFNLWIRMAGEADVVFVDEELAAIRIHNDQVSHSAYRTFGSVGRVGLVAERMEAALHLLASEWSNDPEAREWLSSQLLRLGAERSGLMAEALPGLNLTWDQRVEVAVGKIEALVDPDRSFVLIDSDTWGLTEIGGRRVIPFLERDGLFWGPPADDDEAVEELERARSAGATHVVFGWPAFWMLDFYEGFRRYLERNFDCVAKDSFIIAFDLRSSLRNSC
jgi:glycosyltransferase involved in cell wall biosynthesis